MGVIGRLELAIPDILQFLSQRESTGTLTLTRLEDSGKILFKSGKIVYAAAEAVRNNLGKILVSKNYVNDDSLRAALDLQHNSPRWERLGAILVKKEFIIRDVLEQAIQYQIKQVIREFLAWETGFFRFDTMKINCEDGIVFDVKDFLVTEGMDANHLLLEGLNQLDEQHAANKPTAARAGATPRFNFLSR